jgi:hypothetical protein
LLALLLLKIALAPSLVAAASLVGRRFGPRVGGWLIGFPVVAGPVLGFYAREQGGAFAAGAAAGTVLGTLALCVFLLVYLSCARRLSWAPSMLIGWVAFTAVTLGVAGTPWLDQAGLGARLGLAFAALTVTLAMIPRVRPATPAPRPRRDLLGRMIATALLVLTLTALAAKLGPTLSGLFTPFPVATTILVVFAHREGGADAVAAVYGGFIPSLYSFASFCAALSCGLERWRVGRAFVVALLVSLASQSLVLEWVRHRTAAERPPSST